MDGKMVLWERRAKMSGGAKCRFGILLALLLAAGETEVFAEKISFAESPGASITFEKSANTTLFKGFDFTLMANETASGYQDYTTGRRIGAGFLNMLFGIGSMTMGEWTDGGIIFLFDASAAFAVIGGLALFDYSKSDILEDDFAKIMNYSGWACIGLGVAAYITGSVFGFLWPRDYHKPQPQTAQLNDMRNWNIALYPADDDEEAVVRLGFTMHF
jgi:hypothetical protein